MQLLGDPIFHDWWIEKLTCVRGWALSGDEMQPALNDITAPELVKVMDTAATMDAIIANALASGMMSIVANGAHQFIASPQICEHARMDVFSSPSLCISTVLPTLVNVCVQSAASTTLHRPPSLCSPRTHFFSHL